jgi:hypothetical protein
MVVLPDVAHATGTCTMARFALESFHEGLRMTAEVVSSAEAARLAADATSSAEATR